MYDKIVWDYLKKDIELFWFPKEAKIKYIVQYSPQYAPKTHEGPQVQNKQKLYNSLYAVWAKSAPKNGTKYNNFALQLY